MMLLPAPPWRHALVAAALAAMAFSPVRAAEPTRYPLTLQNCGTGVTFSQAPRRTVSVGQGTTEILLSLGLADRMVGTAVWVGPVLPQFAAENTRIPRLADNDPSFESVVGRSPDLVAAQLEWHVGARGRVGRREQFADLGIPTYVSPADCAAKDNSGSGDGVRREPFTMSLLYQEIRDLAAIFDVADRGEELVAQLRQREAQAVAAVATARARGLSAAFWYSSREVKGDAFVAGRHGGAAYIMRTLGLRNVIETNDEWPTISWEAIAAANPTLLVLAQMDRRRFPADDVTVKRQFLESDPVASQMDAVQKGHVVVLDAQAMNPTLRTIDGIEAVARGIAGLNMAP
jgi:iron complex transport system substrate-binding protein